METPYSGRAIITDNFDKVEIVIPGKRNYFVLLFFCAWMVGWFFGETNALTMFGHDGAIDLFMIAWLTGWTLGGIFVVSTILFMLLGKETIEAGQGTISIRNQALFFLSPKVYDLNEVKHVRALEEFSIYNGFQFGRREQKGILSNYNSGTVKFDYGLKTVKFGNDLDEAEARYIIERLKSKKILTEKNF
ncbi:hypothetical protein IDJ77_06040 [Mucilaginibacter sp. ZT4R22]|uniref:PH (Pleckstrin Homology) domain-containing protein n=1 Tax=Mucilaginibacter pankratovii TaxID=2772110 RepID=A0ABR7WPU1_9SPHI|nr:hypothetical protein [Mucilaginibacter pankratovii]MBD1363364.1 hypothetical protein [Mucilaginibacter pankratovii]